MTAPEQDAAKRMPAEQVAEAIGSTLPHLDMTGQPIPVSVYRLLAGGEPAAPAAVARAAEFPTPTSRRR